LLRELSELRTTGTSRLELLNLRAAVLHLRGSQEWSSSCRELEEEIVLLTRSWPGHLDGISRMDLILSH
jgi:hypothetical protein